MSARVEVYKNGVLIKTYPAASLDGMRQIALSQRQKGFRALTVYPRGGEQHV